MDEIQASTRYRPSLLTGFAHVYFMLFGNFIPRFYFSAAAEEKHISDQTVKLQLGAAFLSDSTTNNPFTLRNRRDGRNISQLIDTTLWVGCNLSHPLRHQVWHILKPHHF